MNSLLSENEILREKLVRKTEECEHLSNEQKQLNEKLSVQFDDIITLKSQIKNFVNANDRDETVFREVCKQSRFLKEGNSYRSVFCFSAYLVDVSPFEVVILLWKVLLLN
jgi:predicted nuclease with TOPRIM domain